ncbi:TetR/AcrR family transcriptional regulator [Companilactobacillus suantsaicola]|uniref:TetR/AcrR family transcriptional regulator n=1 Tax=Companilactobacillus suantsaicola TaxID=2487723 RepID=A0A4Z0JSW4_9LACO|nr:TetR/AcrR family transcriptional regulator [Companilactobacillus suantsaicola]TGD25140.1 TetR/AcrR family transcriptional regulator [Companilactobacillus suantsaicola]
MEKIDRRVQRTNQALQNAFRTLMQETSYRNITVKKLTETAKVNRKTFYLHYDSIDDFSNTIVDKASEKFLSVIVDQSLRKNLIKPGYIFDQVFDLFRESGDFYKIMTTSSDYEFLSRKIELKVAIGFADAIEKEFGVDHIDAYICANFLIRNTMLMFRLYDKNKFDFDLCDFRERLIRLNESGLATFLDLGPRTEK